MHKSGFSNAHWKYDLAKLTTFYTIVQLEFGKFNLPKIYIKSRIPQIWSVFLWKRAFIEKNVYGARPLSPPPLKITLPSHPFTIIFSGKYLLCVYEKLNLHDCPINVTRVVRFLNIFPHFPLTRHSPSAKRQIGACVIRARIHIFVLLEGEHPKSTI